jgi:isocitrate dehydrogenase
MDSHVVPPQDLPLVPAGSDSISQGQSVSDDVLTPITVAHGDGIGPEIMAATLQLLAAAGARIKAETIEIGERVYLAGNSAGIEPSAWDSLRRTKVFLKAPITTPSGGGYKSLNVTVRKTLGLYANVRPCVSYTPFVQGSAPKMDVVIIRENEEDLYAGIEHRQTDEVYQCLKLITRPGCEKIVRYAFEYARANGRKKVTCMTKDNIMKMTDGLFHKVFDEIAAEYLEIQNDHMIIDIGAARLATQPGRFDVVVTSNLYGDIISDIAADVAGSVGLAGSANIGEYVAMFEAIHGSAPDIAGQGIANPSGLMLASVMMLNHIGQHDVAQRVHNAWLCAMEEGELTADIVPSGLASLGTQSFTHAVIARLGREPKKLKPVRYGPADGKPVSIATKAAAIKERPAALKQLVGVDVFVHLAHVAPDLLAERLTQALPEDSKLSLRIITNRGVKVWPNGMPETFCVDQWRCRFQQITGEPIAIYDVMKLLQWLTVNGIDFVKTEHLYTFDGEAGFTLGQGQ